MKFSLTVRAGRARAIVGLHDNWRTAPLEPCRRLTALGGLLAHPNRDVVSGEHATRGFAKKCGAAMSLG